MDKKKAAGITVAIIAAIAGGSWAINLDFSQTTIGQIGDNIINNYVEEQLGIDVDLFKERCANGDYIGTEAETYCDLVP